MAEVSKNQSQSETSFLLPEIEDNDDDSPVCEGTASKPVTNGDIAIAVSNDDSKHANDARDEVSPLNHSPDTEVQSLNAQSIDVPSPQSCEQETERNRSASASQTRSLQREPSMMQLPPHALSIHSAIALHQSHKEEGLTAAQVMKKQKISGSNLRVRVQDKTCCGWCSKPMLGPAVANMSRVIRDGNVVSVSTRTLVPGDLLLLHAGQVVAADVRLMTVQDLIVDTQACTPGAKQSIIMTCCVKSQDPKCRPEQARCMALCGAVVVKGEAKGIVCHTGKGTYIARRLYALRKAKQLEPGEEKEGLSGAYI